jgi:hypothetical protein
LFGIFERNFFFLIFYETFWKLAFQVFQNNFETMPNRLNNLDIKIRNKIFEVVKEK